MNRLNRRSITPVVLLVVLFASIIPVTTIITPFIPVVEAARGTALLATVDCDLATFTCYNITIATHNVTIRPGVYNVTLVDGQPVPGYFAIVFNEVVFDGGVFDLYISKDGYSVLSPGDIELVKGFRVADLYASPRNVSVTVAGVSYTYAIGTFTIGGVAYRLLIGPIPPHPLLTIEYKYIKVFDGITTAVAVSRQTVEFLPAVWITPTWGPPGATVTLYGVLLRPRELVNITYVSPISKLVTQVYTDDLGRFNYTWSIEDLKEGWTGVGSVPYRDILIRVVYNKTELGVVGDVTFRQYLRSFVELRSPIHTALPFTSLYYGAGNNTLVVNARVFDSVIVAGAWWNPTDTVKIYVGATLLAEARPNATHGFFNVTIRVPELARGVHIIRVVNADVTYWFNISVLATLILTPREGPVGTVVDVTAYGLEPNAFYSIWWVGCPGTINVVNATTGPDGRFNVTVRFTVPVDYGGDHTVMACRGYPCPVVDATATFRILPSVTVSPPSFPNDGRSVTVTATGLSALTDYTVHISACACCFTARTHSCGNFTVSIIAAGFRPGLHWVGVYPTTPSDRVAPVAHTTFTVTTVGDPIFSAIASVNGTVAALNATIVEIRGDVAYVRTAVGGIITNITAIRTLVEASRDAVLAEIRNGTATIRTDIAVIRARVDDIAPLVVYINGNVSRVVTTLGTVTATLETIKSLVESSRDAIITEVRNGVATIRTDLGEIRARVEDLRPVILAIRDDVATIKTDVGIVKADASTARSLVEGVRTDVSDVKGTTAALPTISIAVWIAVAFSLIAAVLSALTVYSVRKKIAG